MIDRIYEKFIALIKAEYSPEEALRIGGMLYVAMQEELGADVPLNAELTEFNQEEQYQHWSQAFKICNSYADAITYLRTEQGLEQSDIEEGIKQVDAAQKAELFANFLIVARANPKPVEKPQFINEVSKPHFMNRRFAEAGKPRTQQIEISEKDVISMKLHTEQFLKKRIERTGFPGFPERSRITIHQVKEIPNYREFWLDYDYQDPLLRTYLFSEYMDALGQHEGTAFIRQYLFEERMTTENKERVLQSLRSTSPN